MTGDAAKQHPGPDRGPEPRCWVVTDGKPGMENQCLGLAEALDATPEVKRIRIRAPWRHLPPQFWLSPLSALDPRGDQLAPPWPDLIIATGRQTVAPVLAIKKARGGATFAVQIQNPTTGRRRFDLVAVPAHDAVTGANVVVTLGALHRVTPERLAEAARNLEPEIAALGRPRIAVLIGGSNAVYRMTPAIAADMAARLARLARDRGAALMVTPSRRTGRDAEAALRRGLAGCAAAIWDGSGENPYFGYLGLADAIVVTADSVSMISEACATGKPVHIVDLDGGSAKFRRFHEGLRRAGMTRPFTGDLEDWRYAPLDDTARVAEAVRRRMRSAD